MEPSPRLSRRHWCYLSLGAASSYVTSCRQKEDPPFALADHKEQSTAIIAQHAELVSLTYRDCQSHAASLSNLIKAFVDDPSPPGFSNARQSWIQTRVPYTQGEAYLFQESETQPWRHTIDTWPIQPSYIDGVEANPQSGIVNQLTNFPEITEANIAEAHRQPIPRRATLGFHVLEFLLWGEDSALTPEAGIRSSIDFIQGPNSERRGQLLQVVGERLALDFKAVQDHWENVARQNFLELPSTEALTHILNGIVTLCATGLNEKLRIPYESGSSRDEVSQFSDNTQADLLNNFRSIRNVYEGRYELNERNRLSGATNLRDLIAKASPPLVQQIDKTLATMETHINEMPAPFDQLIAKTNETGREWIGTLLDHAESLGQTFVESGRALGIALTYQA